LILPDSIANWRSPVVFIMSANCSLITPSGFGENLLDLFRAKFVTQQF
jgi:hypothetical protein